MQSHIGISDNFEIPNTQRQKCFAHSFPQLMSTRACQSNFGGVEVTASHFCSSTSFVDSFANSCGGARQTYPQRIRRSSSSLANNAHVRI
jgi:hypothetical protein